MGRLHLAEARIIRVISNGRSDSCRGERIEAVLVMVEDVKRLRSELERDPFCEAEVFADTHIPIVDAGSSQDIAACVPKLAGEGLTEGNAGQVCSDAGSVRSCIDGIGRERVVEPMINVLVESAGIRIADLGATLREAQQEGTGVIAKDRKWETSLKGCNRGNLPAADGGIKRPVHVAAEVLTAADWQLIHEAIDESVVNVKIGTAVVQTRIVLIHVSGERVGRAHASCG